MDKVVLAFIADVLYAKNVICFEELEAIGEVTHVSELDDLTEKILRGEFSVYKRGEHYSQHNTL